MKRIVCRLLFCLVGLACSCSGNHANHKSTDDADHQALHYWEEMDWHDTLQTHHPDSVKPKMLEYLSDLVAAPAKDREESLGGLLHAAASDTTAFRVFTSQLESYLGDPNSPLRNEDFYICYLQQLLRVKTLPLAERTRAEYHLKMAQKNRKGTIATNFSFTTREGKHMKLSQFQAPYLVLVFYDPECPHCSDILDMLYQNPRLQQAISEGKAKVLAVYTEGNRKLWEEKKAEMPAEWTVAIDESKIVERCLYDISAMPMVYLLDQDKRVVIKDAKIE